MRDLLAARAQMGMSLAFHICFCLRRVGDAAPKPADLPATRVEGVDVLNSCQPLPQEVVRNETLSPANQGQWYKLLVAARRAPQLSSIATIKPLAQQTQDALGVNTIRYRHSC